MLKKHIRQEKKTVSKMIRIYCHAKHKTKGNILCEDCKQLEKYTWKKTDNCIFGYLKPACSSCPVHCYSNEKRKKIKEIMQFSGKRMIFLHPWDTILHFINLYRTKQLLKRNTRVMEIVSKLKNP